MTRTSANIIPVEQCRPESPDFPACGDSLLRGAAFGLQDEAASLGRGTRAADQRVAR